MNAAAQVLEDSPEPRRSTAVVSTTPADLVRIALERGSDMAQIEKFMDLQARWDAQEARKAFVAAMSQFKTEPMEILKNKLVSFTTRDGDTTSYRHAELADVTDVVVPAMSKHGLSHRWDIKQLNGFIYVDCVITHALGHSETVQMFGPPDASGKKNAIQQIASTVTYLQRYTLLSATGLATKGADDDGHGGPEDPNASGDAGQGSQASDAGRQRQAPEKPLYPENNMTKNHDTWLSSIEGGSRTADEIIKQIESRFTVTDAQKKTIRALGKKEASK